MLLSSFVKEKHCEVDNVFPSSLELNGGLFNQREGASIATRQRVCVSVCVSSYCTTTCVCRACVYVVLSAEEASLVLFLAVQLQWSSEGLVRFLPEVSLSPTSLLWPTSFTAATSIILSPSSTTLNLLSSHPQFNGSFLWTICVLVSCYLDPKWLGKTVAVVPWFITIWHQHQSDINGNLTNPIWSTVKKLKSINDQPGWTDLQ